MSRAPFVIGKSQAALARNQVLEDTTMGWRFINPAMARLYGVESMPQTGENVAREFTVSRAGQDAFAFRSQQRTSEAVRRGFFADEIVPVIPRAHEKGRLAVVDADEHPRPGTTLEGLAQLKPLFAPPDTVTAGNASGLNDGAAALIIASEGAAARHRLTPGLVSSEWRAAASRKRLHAFRIGMPHIDDGVAHRLAGQIADRTVHEQYFPRIGTIIQSRRAVRDGSAVHIERAFNGARGTRLNSRRFVPGIHSHVEQMFNPGSDRQQARLSKTLMLA